MKSDVTHQQKSVTVSPLLLITRKENESKKNPCKLLTSREPAVICTIQTLRSTRTRLIQTGAGYCLVFAPCLWFNFSLFTQVAPNTSQAHRTAQADYCIALCMGARLFTQGGPHISFNGWARKLDDLIGRNISNQGNLIGSHVSSLFE